MKSHIVEWKGVINSERAFIRIFFPMIMPCGVVYNIKGNQNEKLLFSEHLFYMKNKTFYEMA